MKKKHFMREIMTGDVRKRAIDDGTLFLAGAVEGCEIVLTNNLIASLQKEELAQAIVGAIEYGMSVVEEPINLPIGKRAVRVDYDSDDNVITLMLPDDY